MENKLLVFGGLPLFHSKLPAEISDLIDSMEEDMNTAVSSSSNSSSISDLSSGTSSRLTYLSRVKSNVTVLSGIFPLSSQITSSSFGNVITDRSMKVCRYCLSDDDISEWLAPCKCIGTMKWVHLSCFEQWLAFAPYTMKYSCAICNYVYRRQWRLKPYKDWHWPQFHLRVTDLFGIYFDITLTYRICRYFPRCLDNRVHHGEFPVNFRRYEFEAILAVIEMNNSESK